VRCGSAPWGRRCTTASSRDRRRGRAAGRTAATFTLSGAPIFDNKATHDGLAAQFGDASWYPHLVAANTDHAAFIVYLDTRDATVQAEACTALSGAAAGLGRVPDLYYATGGHARFARSC
jgi:hypothetical protein